VEGGIGFPSIVLVSIISVRVPSGSKRFARGPMQSGVNLLVTGGLPHSPVGHERPGSSRDPSRRVSTRLTKTDPVEELM
jgi:hypothetical protein